MSMLGKKMGKENMLALSLVDIKGFAEHYKWC